MILSEVEETITTVEIDEETYEELFKVSEFVTNSGHNLTACILQKPRKSLHSCVVYSARMGC